MITKSVKSVRERRRSLFAAGFAAAVSLFALVDDLQAAPPAIGTKIENVASATYFNPTLGIRETVVSNTVIAEVAAVPGIEVYGNDVRRLTSSSESFYGFQVVNVGNTSADVSLGLAEATGDDFDVIGQLYIDVNGDGLIDAEDRLVAFDTVFSLDPGESISLIYLYLTPASVTAGDESVSVLTVNGTFPEIDAPAVEISREGKTIIADTALAIVKSATYREDTREIDYTLTFTNNGEFAVQPYSLIDGEAVQVNGEVRSVVLIRDAIPMNTHLAGIGSTGELVAVFHAGSGGTHEYTTAQPTDLSSVEAIAFFLDHAIEPRERFDLNFSVRVNDGIGDTAITNTAEGYTIEGGVVVTTPSNEVVIDIDDVPGGIDFYDGTYETEVTAIPFGTTTGVRVTSGACNLSMDPDTITVTITTELARDREVVTALETGGNTGIFEIVPLSIVERETGIQGNAVIEARRNDRALATTTCDDETLVETLTVQPGGIVFDSLTNLPISGAQVQIFDPETGDLLGETLTDSDGYFSLSDIRQGQCVFAVVPPISHQFPSVQRTSFDSFGRDVDDLASYGEVFACEGDVASIDIPVDPASFLPITVEKTVDRRDVSRGDYLTYTLEGRNEMSISLLQAEIEDRLPAGLIYVEGSARIDGEHATDPIGAPGRTLVFPVGLVAPETSVSIQYSVKVAATAGEGEKINAAFMRGRRAGIGDEIESQLARAVVTVDDRGTVFASEAVVLGKVFIDINENGIQDDERELGIPGVKIVTSNGLSVVTDERGRYSLFGLPPRTQVFSIQKSTLPTGAELLLQDVDDALRPGTRFIDLKRSELRSEDFAVAHTDATEQAVLERRAAFQGLDEDESLFRGDLPLTFGGGTSPLSSRRETAVDTSTDFTDGKVSERTPRREREKVVSTSPEDRKARLEGLLPSLTPEFDFHGIESGMVAERRSLDVIVKSPAEAKLALSVNGEPVSGTKIGTKVIDRTAGIQAFEYIAVPLAPGENELTATLTDPFGNERGRVTRIVNAPGDAARIEMIAPQDVPADSSVRVPVVLRVVDRAGRRVRAPAEITLSAVRGAWDVEDIRDTVPGVQVYVDNGEGTFDYLPPDLVGSVTLIASADFGESEAEIRVSPDLDERVFVGVIEGALGFGESGERLDGLIEEDNISFFEDTVEGVRGQLYLKGKILGDSLLTLRYDSDQDTEDRLFRDIARDEYYPIYGDNSERGFDAQSSSQLFVKVEREQSFILYGDIAVEPEAQAIRLGAYRRSLTGAKAHYEGGPVTLTVFAAETEQGQRIVEIPGRGVSGPYDVALDGIVDGSERVEIITRDRDQPSVILSTLSQSRFIDYSLDYFAGALIFNRPIAQLDDDLNPVSIRVTYETETSAGDRYWVYGGEIRYEPMDGLAIGYREVRSDADADSEDRRTVRSAYVEADLGTYGELELEAAQTENNLGDSGFGYRAEYEISTDRTTFRAEAARTDEDFDAPGSYVSAGREEVNLTAEHQINDRMNATAEALYTRNVENGDERYGAELRTNYGVNNQFTLTTGARAVRTRSGDTETDVISGIVGVTYRPEQIAGLALRAEYEQDFVEFNNWRLTLGGDYQYNPALRFYALNEISTTESGFFGIGDGADTNFTTKVGVEYRVNEYVDGFTEYRDGGRGPGDGVANGIRAEWAPTVYVTLRGSAEHVEPVKDGAERSSSIALGAEYDNPDSGIVLRGDAEWNGRDDSNSYFGNLAFGYEYNDSLTLLLRNRIALDDRGGEDRLRDRLRFGIAYRPRQSTKIRLLGWYEYEIDDDVTTTQAHRWSFGGAYSHNDRWRSNARYAGKYTDFRTDTVRDSNTLHMGLIGTEYEIWNNRVSLGLNGAVFTDSGFDNVTFGVGAELKADVTEQLQVSVGYNHVELEEDRVRDLYYSGWFVRARMKLDDSVWDAFDNGVEAFGSGPSD